MTGLHCSGRELLPFFREWECCRSCGFTMAEVNGLSRDLRFHEVETTDESPSDRMPDRKEGSGWLITKMATDMPTRTTQTPDVAQIAALASSRGVAVYNSALGHSVFHLRLHSGRHITIFRVEGRAADIDSIASSSAFRH